MIIGCAFIAVLLIWANMMTRAVPEPKNKIAKVLQGEFFYHGNSRYCRECGQREDWNEKEKGWFLVGRATGVADCSLDHEEEDEGRKG
jgi:hypothetical protein